VITVILALQPLFTPLLLLIPLVQIPAGYGIALLVGCVMYKMQGGGRAVAITITENSTLVVVAGIIAGVVGIVPLVGYGLTMILTGSHILCLVVEASLSFLIAIIANRFVSRLLKD